MNNKQAIIFIGIQASGKSTYYHRYFGTYEHVNLDTLHTRNKENLLLQECIRDEKSFVVDNTNPTCSISGEPTVWATSATLTVSGSDTEKINAKPYCIPVSK